MTAGAVGLEELGVDSGGALVSQLPTAIRVQEAFFRVFTVSIHCPFPIPLNPKE